MSQETSKLWSRRKTSRADEIPMLSPLYSTALVPTSAYPIDCVPTPPSRPLPTSPALYTPTEAVGILLGKSPSEAAQSTRLAVDSLTAKLPFASPRSEQHYHYYSSPCSPFLDRQQYSDIGDYLCSPISSLQDDFNFDIDTAALATEVALEVLSSADCFGEPDEPARSRKLRLLLPWDQALTSRSYLSPSSYQPSTSERGTDTAERPIRKGRARMSQEKRKRLARRKEREAMLLGIPPKPVSAPPHISHFPLPASNQLQRGIFAWKQPRQSWTQEARRPSTNSITLNRSEPATDESSSRCSSTSAASLDADQGNSSLSITPLTSPECSRRPCYSGSGVETMEDPCHPISCVPRLSLQPPSPQQCRTAGPRHLPPIPSLSPVADTKSKTASPPKIATPTMRWSTTQGLMTSQGVPLASPRSDIFWPQIFTKLDLQPSKKSDTTANTD